MLIGQRYFAHVNKTKKEIARFFIAGLIVLLTDALIYSLFLFWLAPSFAKAIAFACGTIVAYFINKFWTFEKNSYSHKELAKFIFLYMATMIANVGINALFLLFAYNLFIAYIMATGISASLNFIGQKFFVFNKND